MTHCRPNSPRPQPPQEPHGREDSGMLVLGRARIPLGMGLEIIENILTGLS